MAEWKCPICGYDTDTDGMIEHLKGVADQPHRELLKEKMEDTSEDVRNKAKDAWESVKDTVDDTVDKVTE